MLFAHNAATLAWAVWVARQRAHSAMRRAVAHWQAGGVAHCWRILRSRAWDWAWMQLAVRCAVGRYEARALRA